MKRLLVTGADGFVGRWLVRAARAGQYQVVAAILPGSSIPEGWHSQPSLSEVEVVRADFRSATDVEQLATLGVDAVVHLAAIASGSAARADPDAANLINAERVALLGERLSQANRPRFLFVSTGEVYGPGHAGPIPESALRHPGSPYAASKAAAEMALERLGGSGELPVIVARAFPHSGPGQSTTYVLPALVDRLKEAKRTGVGAVRTGNLTAVRDFLDVQDVVRAYLALLERGAAGEVYNVASGVGHRLSDCFATLARVVGVSVEAREDAALLRPGDIPVLIGDAGKLRRATGWTPAISFERMLQDLVDAQAN